MRKNFGRSAKMSSDKMSDPSQLDLFGDLDRDDPLAVFYRKIRKAGGWLTYDRAEDRIFAGHDNGVLGAWVVSGMRLLRDRIIEDLLRIEYGIEPAEEPEHLTGGAVLHRLPTRRMPEMDPPVRQRTPTDTRRGPGAA